MKNRIAVGGTVVVLAAFWGYHRTGLDSAAQPKELLAHATSQPAPHGQLASLSSAHRARLHIQAQTGGASEPVLGSDFAARLNALLADNDPSTVETRRNLIRRWAELAPSAAAAWAAALGFGPVYQEALQQVAVAWAESDLSSARQWLTALPDSDAKSAGLISLGYEAARTDPAMALELASGLPPAPERDDLLVHAASQWASVDLDSALSWAGEVRDPGLRQRLIASIATASAKLDGAAAASLIANLMVPGEEQNRAAVEVVQRWAQAAPQAALDWVNLYPAGPVHDAAARSLLELQRAQQGNQDQGSPERVGQQEPEQLANEAQSQTIEGLQIGK
jgi:hypothetical protein